MIRLFSVRLRWASVRAVQQLENAIKTLLRVKPEFQNGKIIPMIYAKRYTEGLIEACEKGIYMTSGLVDLTSFRLAKIFSLKLDLEHKRITFVYIKSLCDH